MINIDVDKKIEAALKEADEVLLRYSERHNRRHPWVAPHYSVSKASDRILTPSSANSRDRACKVIRLAVRLTRGVDQPVFGLHNLPTNCVAIGNFAKRSRIVLEFALILQ